MQTFLYLALSAILVSAGRCAPGPQQPDPSPSIITPLFHAQFHIEPPLGPIPAPAGGRIIEPIPRGTVTGAINGTITSGFVAPILYSPLGTNFTSTSDAYLYGVTDSGEVFYVQAAGIGKNGKSVARLSIEAGGAYEYLQSEFVFGRIVTDFVGGRATLEGFVVAQP
ncbi:hypothetical protein BJY04DRAFT_199228 [Aspergillus karnatakaensis]|uniref:uncharacterized protein n=1 Tax=Aspergillus karnatakaensis TaxID=1810916 RepID=UPI003CCDE344